MPNGNPVSWFTSQAAASATASPTMSAPTDIASAPKNADRVTAEKREPMKTPTSTNAASMNQRGASPTTMPPP
jgi:hypothetical protein